MRTKDLLTELVIVFCIVTTGITILEAILGTVFYPDVVFGFEAYWGPPFFGILSTLAGLVTKSRKELSAGQMLFRQFLQLLLIEGIVFGVNFVCGTMFSASQAAILAIAIAVIFVFVYFVFWLNDQRSARLFNEKLKEFQENITNQ